MPPRLKLHHRPSLHLYPNSLSRRETQQEEGSMGSTSSRHASRPPTHPRPKKTLKRTLSSIFVCGSSSSTLPNETEDDPTEDYRNRGNPTKFQRPKKEFTHILTSPRTKNRAFLESNVVVNGNPSSESSSSNHNTPLPEPNPSKERVEVSFINENDDTVERVTQCNQSSHAFDDLLAVENEFLVDNSSSESVNAHQETIPLILGLNVPEREQEQGDVTSVSSENDTRELRVDGRRLIWDAFVMDNGGRLSDSQSFLLSSDDLDDSDDSGSGDVSLDGGVGGDSRNLGSQTHSFIERRQHTSSEIWESIRHGQTGRCPSGLHSYGSCSCEPTPITHDTRPRASLSRIFTLADTLFEVLDEIQRQPLSLPSNMNSLPAPNSVVDSLPLKSHKVKHKSENDIEQCQICLAEYEEGDEIRVLPCHHEYHMSCVDKWLKESHRVCPLCRGDVCEAEATVSNPEIPLA